MYQLVDILGLSLSLNLHFMTSISENSYSESNN